jgi:hypothetical protein
MENQSDNKEQEKELTQKDHQQLPQDAAEGQQDDAEQTAGSLDTPDLVGDLHPTARVETSQEELNAEIENKESEASKISGEQL